MNELRGEGEWLRLHFFLFLKKCALGYSLKIHQNVGLHWLYIQATLLIVSQFCSVMRTCSEKFSKRSKI